MKNHFLHLMRKEDVIDMYRIGKWEQVALSSKKGFDGKLDDKNTIGLVKEMFGKAAPFEYSNEYYLVHVYSQKKSSFEIKDVCDIIPMDNESYNMGLHLSPEIRLSKPIFEECYHEFQINCEIKNAIEGIMKVLDIFNIKHKVYQRFCGDVDEDKLMPLMSDIYYDRPISGDRSLWYYLLRYTRHHSYPNDTRGYFLDAVHAFFNYEKQKEMDCSVSESGIGKDILRQDSNVKYMELVGVVEANEQFFNRCEAAEKDYYRISPLFLKLKSLFADGIKPDNPSCAKHIAYFVNATNMYGESVMVKALCLLGILLGRENTYQYSYLKQKHPILKV